MAYSSSRYFHGSSSLGGCWDLQNLGLLNPDTMSLGSFDRLFLFSFPFPLSLHCSCLLRVLVPWWINVENLIGVNLFAVMDGVSPFFSSLESDFSTGYLEDALLEFSERSKRRRLLLYTDDHTKISDDHHFAKVIQKF